MKKIVLAGGTGFIGTYFKEKFESLNYHVKIISRSADIRWEDKDAIIQALNGAEMLINLAGKSVNCRYNDKNKRAILDSRIKTTNMLGKAMQECENPPSVWFNFSTATIYRHAEDRPMSEENGEIGSGFSVDVATNWEKAFFAYDSLLPNTRLIALRTAIVLGKNGGVMTPYVNLTKFGLGGKQGNGKQMFSWIHVEDMYQIIQFLNQNKTLSGVFNCSAPNPVTNRQQMQLFREKLGVSFGLPAARWMLEIGAFFLRTETELMIKSRWVIPERLEKAGFTFSFPTLAHTLDDILKD